jgi:hypothetical protein
MSRLAVKTALVTAAMGIGPLALPPAAILTYLQSSMLTQRQKEPTWL